MNYYWCTRIYFQQRRDWSYPFLVSVFEAIASAGFDFQKSSSSGAGRWTSPEGWPYKDVDSLDAALKLTEQHFGGNVTIHNPSNGIHASLGIYSRGANQVSSGAAEEVFGNITLYVSGNELVEHDETLYKSGVLSVFQASLLLATTVEAIYGVGDFESSRLETCIVLAEDIESGRIPRLAWWNYFNKDYLYKIGRNRFTAGSAWHDHEGDNYRVIVMRPPTGQFHAAPEDLQISMPSQPPLPNGAEERTPRGPE